MRFLTLAIAALVVACCSHGGGTAPSDCSAEKGSATTTYGPPDQVVEVTSTESVWAWLEAAERPGAPPEARRVTIFAWGTGACIVTSVP